MTPVRLEPAAPLSRVKQSTTEPVHSHNITVQVADDLPPELLYAKPCYKKKCVIKGLYCIKTCLRQLSCIETVLYLIYPGLVGQANL